MTIVVSSNGLIFAYFILENWSLTLAYSLQSFLHKMFSPFYYKMSVFQQTIILYQKMHTIYFLPVFLSIWLTFFFIADDADVMLLPAPVMIEKCYITVSNQSSIKDLKTWALFFPNETNLLFFQKKLFWWPTMLDKMFGKEIPYEIELCGERAMSLHHFCNNLKKIKFKTAWWVIIPCSFEISLESWVTW